MIEAMEALYNCWKEAFDEVCKHFAQKSLSFIEMVETFKSLKDNIVNVQKEVERTKAADKRDINSMSLSGILQRLTC